MAKKDKKDKEQKKHKNGKKQKKDKNAKKAKKDQEAARSQSAGEKAPQVSAEEALATVGAQLAPLLVPGSFQTAKTSKPKSWIVDAELDLSKGPLLFLALNSINDGMRPNPSWPRGWVRVSHQAGGISCDSVELTGTVLVPRPSVVEKMRELARRWDGSEAGALGGTLKDAMAYAADLQELLGVSCNYSFKKFQEAVSPIDPDDVTKVAPLTEDRLPEVLDELLLFEQPFSKLYGWADRWCLYVLSENSD